MGHSRQRGRCTELVPVSRRNGVSLMVRHFVDIASRAARLMPCPPRLTPRRGDLSEGWGNLSEGLKWERPPVLGNSLHPDRITQARARNWRHADHFKQTTRTRVQGACCTLRQRNRPETGSVRRNRSCFPQVPLGPSFDPPFGGYRREGWSVRYGRGEGESRGRAAAGAPFIAPTRQARGRQERVHDGPSDGNLGALR
jgi:hypothetical protein